MTENDIHTKQCDECYAVHNASLRECLECGHEYETERERKINEVDGELVEIEAKQKRIEQATARSLEQLRAIAKARGYKRGWAEHVYKSRKNKMK